MGVTKTEEQSKLKFTPIVLELPLPWRGFAGPEDYEAW